MNTAECCTRIFLACTPQGASLKCRSDGYTCINHLHIFLFIDNLLVAHQIYGVAHTINSANYMYFKALEKVLSLNHPDCINIFTGTHR